MQLTLINISMRQTSRGDPVPSKSKSSHHVKCVPDQTEAMSKHPLWINKVLCGVCLAYVCRVMVILLTLSQSYIADWAAGHRLEDNGEPMVRCTNAQSALLPVSEWGCVKHLCNYFWHHITKGVWLPFNVSIGLASQNLTTKCSKPHPFPNYFLKAFCLLDFSLWHIKFQRFCISSKTLYLFITGQHTFCSKAFCFLWND